MDMVGVQVHGVGLHGVSASTTSSVVLDPGSWSLDNFGEQLIATIKDSKNICLESSFIKSFRAESSP